jgi:hypothetical protein
MPAKDKYHDVVTRALTKDGWFVSPKPYRIISGKRNLYVDIQATKREQESAIFVEIKSFIETESPIELLAHATGQYLLYRVALDALGNAAALYLAIPEHAYFSIFSEPLAQLMVERFHIKIVVYAIENEEIKQWI